MKKHTKEKKERAGLDGPIVAAQRLRSMPKAARLELWAYLATMYQFSTNEGPKPDEVRERLRTTDEQLLEFGKAANFMCSARGEYEPLTSRTVCHSTRRGAQRVEATKRRKD